MELDEIRLRRAQQMAELLIEGKTLQSIAALNGITERWAKLELLRFASHAPSAVAAQIRERLSQLHSEAAREAARRRWQLRAGNDAHLRRLTQEFLDAVEQGDMPRARKTKNKFVLLAQRIYDAAKDIPRVPAAVDGTQKEEQDHGEQV